MKISKVVVNNRKGQLELTTRSGDVHPVPFTKLDPLPSPHDRIGAAYVDRELASEAVTYVLESGAEGAVHIDQALEYNRDPLHLLDCDVQLIVKAKRAA